MGSQASSTVADKVTFDLRLITRVARLRYVAGLTQQEISRKFGISQSTVSRVLREAVRRDIVRITVHEPVCDEAPSGAYAVRSRAV